jgi:uncharacterized protein YndB with AHSA1/START domain
MKTEIITDLNLATFEARREFNGELPLVWRAWTEADILDQWWAPAPWKCQTLFMDFREGGRWLYDMVGPEREIHSAVQLYHKIEFEVYFSGKDAFADEQGNINERLPVSTWKNTFIRTENGTLVTCFAQYPDKESLETVIKMGMSEGLTQAQDQLDKVLAQLKEVLQ